MCMYVCLYIDIYICIYIYIYILYRYKTSMAREAHNGISAQKQLHNMHCSQLFLMWGVLFPITYICIYIYIYIYIYMCIYIRSICR